MENIENEKMEKTATMKTMAAELGAIVDKYKVKTVVLYMECEGDYPEVTILSGDSCHIGFGIARIAEHMEENSSEEFDAVSFLNQTANGLKKLKIVRQLKTMFGEINIKVDKGAN
jgi:hypothetical protein